MKTSPGSGGGSRLQRLWRPAENGRSPATVILILLVLLVTAVLLGRFGIENVGGALTYTGRISGALLIVLSVTTLLGALAVVDHWFRNSFPPAGLVALIATVAACAGNIFLLVTTARDGDSTPYLVLWCLLVVGSAWAALAVYRTLVVIPAPKRVAVAVVVTTAVAVANFGYENLYKPTQREGRPRVDVVVGKPAVTKDRKAFAIPVDITLENRSNVGFYVFGAEFHAMGEVVPLSPKDRLTQQWRADAQQWGEYEQRPLSRREIHQPGDLVAAQPLVRGGSWIEPGDTVVTQTVVQLPMNTQYDQLAFYASVSLASKDRLRLESFGQNGFSWKGVKLPQWMVDQNKWSSNPVDSVVSRGRVHEGNAIAEHTRDPRYVTVYWQFGKHGAGLKVAVTRDGEEDRELPDEENRDLRNWYGLADVLTGPIERTLWDIKGRR
ncbi:hypothetical protein OG937_45810 [Streptomyces sp. NBC_00510]